MSTTVRWTICPAVLLALAAMIVYPGGTPADSASERYSLSQNFLSDLGMTVAYDGQQNHLGASLFIASLMLLVVGLGYCLARLIRLYGEAPAARIWIRIAAVCGVAACVAFAAVAVTPENEVISIHMMFTAWGWRAAAAAAAAMAVASFRSPLISGGVSFAWALLAAVLAAYVALMMWGPSVQSPSGLEVQVVAQKIATIVLLLLFTYIVRQSERIAPSRA